MAKRTKFSVPKKKYIQEICAGIDRSGSMRGKEQDTIGGINETFRVLYNLYFTISIKNNIILIIFVEYY